MPNRTVGILTTTRADYGLLRSLIQAVLADPDLELRLLVTGTHLSAEHGHTVDAIEADGVPVWRRVPILAEGGDEAAVARTAAAALDGLAEVFAAERPDLLVVLGDRTETLACGLAALVFRIPLAHIHGGETTAGAIDEAARHALTKMAAYHFAATEDYAANIRQLGEDPARVFTVGAPGLDQLVTGTTPDRREIFARLDLDPDRTTALVTFHPVTTDPPAEVGRQADAVIGALVDAGLQAVLTGANADAAGDLINTRLKAAAAAHPDRLRYRVNLGTELYLGCLAHCDLVVGNSSSGLIEAPSFGVPVINVGDRQAGRVQADNVIQAACEPEALAAALDRALDDGFRAACRNVTNPYAPAGAGGIGVRIKDILKSVPLGPDVLKKQFVRRGE